MVIPVVIPMAIPMVMPMVVLFCALLSMCNYTMGIIHQSTKSIVRA